MRFDNNKETIEDIPTINIVYILDSSSSMSTKYENAKRGFLEELSELSTRTDVKYTFTFVEFSSNLTTHIYKEVNLDVVNKALLNLRMLGGMTSLHDAVGETLSKLTRDNIEGEKTLVNIATDGGENNSRKFRAGDVKELTASAEKLGFTVTFVGTVADTKVAVQDYGLKMSNTLNHDNTAKGMEKMSRTRSAATKQYSSFVVAGQDVSEDFYTKFKE